MSTEALGMIGVFYASNRTIHYIYPYSQQWTVLARLIILQGKGMDPNPLVYEVGAILLLWLV